MKLHSSQNILPSFDRVIVLNTLKIYTLCVLFLFVSKFTCGTGDVYALSFQIQLCVKQIKSFANGFLS